jgi:Tfp pilus assembly protein FimT
LRDVWSVPAEHSPILRTRSPSSGQSARHVPGPRGVTFIELITLTIVILILAMIGIPRVSPIVQNFQLKGAAWQLGGDLRLARQRAVTTQRRFRVCVTGCKITLPAGTYSVEVEQPPMGSLKWSSETGAPARLPPGVCVSANASGTATFAANGMASGNTFTLYNLIGEYQVTVASTGQVTVAAVTGVSPPSCP